MANLTIEHVPPAKCNHCLSYDYDKRECTEDYCIHTDETDKTNDITDKETITMREVINLKDMKKCEVKGLLSEMLFDMGICVREFHAEYFFNECTHGKKYEVMYEGDIDIIFEKCNDKDYPIMMSYVSTYSPIEYMIDYITQEMFDKFKEIHKEVLHG